MIGSANKRWEKTRSGWSAIDMYADLAKNGRCLHDAEESFIDSNRRECSPIAIAQYTIEAYLIREDSTQDQDENPQDEGTDR